MRGAQSSENLFRRAPFAAISLLWRFIDSRFRLAELFFIRTAFLEVKVEVECVLDKCIGASDVATLDLSGDSLLKRRTESDVHRHRCSCRPLVS